MNTRDKIAYGRVKLPGIKDQLLYNDGDSGMIQILQRMLRDFAKPEYQTRSGIMTIELTFDGPLQMISRESDDPVGDELRANAIPIDDYLAAMTDSNERELTEIMMAGIEDNLDDKAKAKLIQEYRLMANYLYRANKSREYIMAVKTQIESQYIGREAMIMWNLGGEWWQI